MTSYSTGKQAEAAAANYLVQNAYNVIDQNWRTRWCEIDIIATKQSVVYFVEVKYRATSINGSGLDYITRSKLRQMARAAESWILKANWTGDYQLSAIELTGPEFTVQSFLKDLY